MSTPTELEAALRSAEIQWQAAWDAAKAAQAERAKAHANWQQISTEVHAESAARGNAAAGCDEPAAERSAGDGGIAALSLTVAIQHRAYLARENAEAACAAAEARLGAAAAAREQALAALAAHKRSSGA